VEDVMGLIEDRDAQFMLLAGFIIGIGLVITTVMLNSIMFEGNMAIESVTENSKYDMINLMQITTNEIRSAYRNSTEKGDSVPNATFNFTRQVNNFSTHLPKIYSMYGGGANIRWENWTNKGRANFTQNGMPGGNSNWTLVEGVNASSVSVFNVTINFTGAPGDFFKIEARDTAGSFKWSMEFNNTNIYNVTNVTNSSFGSIPSNRTLNLISPEYYFKMSILLTPVSIHIINGENAFGTYKIQGIANGRNFTRERHYILNTTIGFSTSKVKGNITMPVSVPW
jgi:hypothetical protein